MIIRGKTEGSVDIRALHAVFISVERFRIYLSSGSGFLPCEPGADTAFFQIVGWKGIQSGSSSFDRSSSDLMQRVHNAEAMFTILFTIQRVSLTAYSAKDTERISFRIDRYGVIFFIQ